MKGRRLFLQIGMILLIGSLSLLFSACNQNQSGLTHEEIGQTVRTLIEAAGPLNEIFYGEGLPVEAYDEKAKDGTAVAFHYVRVRQDAPYQDIASLKEAAGQVFAKSYLSVLYESAFDGTEEIYARYAEDSEGRLTRNVKQKVKTTDEWTKWNYDTIKVKTARNAIVIVEIDGTFAGRTETEQIMLEKETEGWRLSTAVY